MSYKPNGSDDWPDNVRVNHAGFDDLFSVRWFYSDLPLDGFHNVDVPYLEQEYDNAYAIPAYACPACASVLLVPFPEVEKSVELYAWFRRHVEQHDPKPQST
jgi:hypothetical protein